MQKKIHITIAIISMLLLTACNSEVRQAETAKPEKNTKQTKEDERGYDPCLINANLPVCAKK